MDEKRKNAARDLVFWIIHQFLLTIRPQAVAKKCLQQDANIVLSRKRKRSSRGEILGIRILENNKPCVENNACRPVAGGVAGKNPSTCH
jgi:hypothetical protein